MATANLFPSLGSFVTPMFSIHVSTKKIAYSNAIAVGKGEGARERKRDGIVLNIWGVGNSCRRGASVPNASHISRVPIWHCRVSRWERGG